MREFLEFVVRQLVEFPDEAIITEIPSGRTTVFRLQLRQSDVGRIIGRNGQTIQSIRALLSSAASRHNQRAKSWSNPVIPSRDPTAKALR